MKSASNPPLKRATLLISLCLSGLLFTLGWFALHSQQQVWQEQLQQQQQLIQAQLPALKDSPSNMLKSDFSVLLAQHQQESRTFYLQWTLAWLLATATLLALLLKHLRRTQQLSQQQQQLRQQHALRALNEIAALANISRTEQIRQALVLGVNFFSMPIAIVSHVSGQDFRILVQVSTNDGLADGQHFDLRDTYCQLVIEQQQVVAIEHMAKSTYADLSCYQQHQLESYIGCPLWVNGQLFGVLNFAAAEPRTRPFDDTERDFVRLLARWIGAILERDEQEQAQQALLTRLQHITSQVPGAIFEFQINPDGQQFFPYASEGLKTIYGVSPEEIREDSGWLYGLAHPDDKELIPSSIAQSLQDLTLWHLEFRIIHPEKGLIWIEGRSMPQRLADGSTRWYGFITDITARKLVQEQLQQARSFLQAVVDSSTEVSLIATDPSGVITLFNSGAERLLGYSASEMIGQSPSQFHLAEEVEQRGLELSQQLQREVRGFEVFVVLPQSGQAENKHWTYVRKDQQRRLVDLTVTTISDGQGELQGYLGIAIDITQLEQTNRALQTSEQRFRSLVDSLPGVVYRCANDSDWSMLYLSEDITRLTGYPASDFIGNRVRSFASLQHPDDQPQIAATQANIARQEPFAVSYRIRHAAGHWVWVNEKGRGDYDENGHLLWLNGFIWDITEQREAELANAINERKLSALYQLAPVGITLTRFADGQMLDSNPEFQRMQGMTAEQVTRVDYRQTVPAEFQAEQARQMELLRQKGTYGPFEKELLHLDGSRVPVLLNGVLLEGPDGSLLIWSIIQDISQRVATEQEAREREEYIRALFNNVIDAIITIDSHGLIEDFNRAAEHIFGYSADAVIGHNISMLMPEPDRSQHDSYIARPRPEHGISRMISVAGRELIGLRANGEQFPMELSVSSIQYHGVRKFIGVIRDITERRRIEQMKSEFVSTVSHELRTPLTSISGALGLIVGGALGPMPERAQGMLQVALENSQRLGLLINDLLDMDKLLAGKMHFTLQAQALQPLLDEALKSNREYAAQHNVQLLQAATTPEWVVVDSLRLHQVLSNYLSNAAKFSAPDSLVTLAVERRGECVRVSVIDQGCGIPAAFHERIFHKFSQADASDNRNKGGTGLGLGRR